MSLKFGIFPGSFKPFHLGHMNVVEEMAKQCDTGIVLVSKSDRIRRGEFPVYGQTMIKIWNEHISKILPKNISYVFCDNPVTLTYQMIPTFLPAHVFIYGDATDIVKNFSYHNLERYCKQALMHELIDVVPIVRQTCNISGTQVRQYLKNDQYDAFVSVMHPSLGTHEIWDLLHEKHS